MDLDERVVTNMICEYLLEYGYEKTMLQFQNNTNLTSSNLLLIPKSKQSSTSNQPQITLHHRSSIE